MNDSRVGATGSISGVSHSRSNEPDISIEDLTAYVHRAEEGGWWAEVPALPGCLTQGETLDEVVDNLNDAIQGWLSVQTPEALREKGIRFTVLPEATPPVRLPRIRTLEFAA